MNSEESSIKKMCSLYVSDWHLTTMMLPYISRLLEQGIQVETMMEQGMEEKIKTLMEKLNMNPKTKQKMLKIHWNTTKEIPVEIKKGEGNKQRVIIINGSKERIEKINEALEKDMSEKERKRTTIVNCYPVTDRKQDMQEILETYDKMINTSGEHKISEIFQEDKNA